jgi:hypothetical protein
VTIVNPAAFIQAGSYSALSDRLHMVSCRFLPIGSSTTAMTARGGFLMGQSNRIANYNMVTWDVTVGPFAAIVQNTFAAQGGEYLVLNTSNTVVTVAASSPTTNRIDIIGVRVQDAFYSGALNQADIVVVAGTPTAGAPADPALPSTFLPIVRVTVSASSVTGVTTDMRSRQAPTGAVYQPYTPQLTDNGTVIGETQLLPAAGVYPARLRVWDGSAWKGVSNYAFAPPSITALNPLNAAVQHIASTLAVADPGFAYKLRTSGSLDWAMVNANQPDNPLSLSVTLDSTDYATNTISRGNQYSINATASQPSPTAIAPTAHTASLTGAHTLRLIARNSAASQPMRVFALDALNTSSLTAELVPA